MIGPTNKIVIFLFVKVGAEHLKLKFFISFIGKNVIT